MTFRKDSLLFYQSEFFYVVMAMLCFLLIPILGIEISLLYMFPFIILILVNFILQNEFITIDDTGILCQKSGKIIWLYEWDSIAELKRSTRYLMPSIEVIIYDKCGKPEHFSLTNQYFQLGRIAKKAIKQFYKKTD